MTRCCLEQVTFTPCLGHLSQEAVDRQPTWTDFYEAGDYFVPNVCSPRDLVARPDNMDETVPHTHIHNNQSRTNGPINAHLTIAQV